MAVGSPDKDRLRPDTYKKDGNPSYYKTFTKVEECTTANKHGYVIIAEERHKIITVNGTFGSSPIINLPAASQTGLEYVIQNLQTQIDQLKNGGNQPPEEPQEPQNNDKIYESIQNIKQQYKRFL